MRDSIPATVSAIVVPAPRWPSAISVMRARLPAGTHGCGDWCIGDSFVVGAQASGLRFGRGTAIGLQQPVEELIGGDTLRSEEHTSELQSRGHLVCRLLLEKKI